MIEADGRIAARAQKRMGDLELRDARLRTGQSLGRDQSLMLLEMRHMGIAEHGQTVGIQRQHLLDGARDVTFRLIGQPVDQIDIERGDAGSAQAHDRAFGHLEGWIRLIAFCTLPSQSCTPMLARLTPALGQRGDHLVRKPARIDLDGEFGIRAQL